MKKQWTLQALAIEMRRDLQNCTSDFERQNCRGLCAREIKALATDIQATRKLSPAEQAILADL
jgi:hypothetical protein